MKLFIIKSHIWLIIKDIDKISKNLLLKTKDYFKTLNFWLAQLQTSCDSWVAWNLGENDVSTYIYLASTPRNLCFALWPHQQHLY